MALQNLGDVEAEARGLNLHLRLDGFTIGAGCAKTGIVGLIRQLARARSPVRMDTTTLLIIILVGTLVLG